MNDRDHGRAMLELAEHDLRALRGMLSSSVDGEFFFTDAIYGFHAQQAVEKMLKAWLSYCGITFPLTHDLHLLLDRLRDATLDIAGLEDLTDLSPFAVQYRYETLLPVEENLDREEVLQRVNACYERVNRALSA